MPSHKSIWYAIDYVIAIYINQVIIKLFLVNAIFKLKEYITIVHSFLLQQLIMNFLNRDTLYYLKLLLISVVCIY